MPCRTTSTSRGGWRSCMARRAAWTTSRPPSPAGVLAVVVVFRRRSLRVAAGLVPPPWRLRDGLVVLVRGGGVGVLVTLLLIGLARLRPPDDPWLSGVGLPMMYVPLLVLARRRL